MKQHYPQHLLSNSLTVLRRAGYGPFTDPRTGEQSFVLRLQSGFYPRFHVYVEKRGDKIVLSLHLDQKQASYGTETKHSGEYSGPVVEEEMARIDRWVRYMATAKTGNKPATAQKKKPWWRIF